MPIEATWWEHAFVGLVALGGLYAVFRGQPQSKQIEWDTPARISTYLANTVVLFALGGITVLLWWFADRPLPALGLRLGSYGAWTIGLAASFVVVMVLETRYRLSEGRIRQTVADWVRDTPFMPRTRREYAWSIPLSLAAGINEEIFFRGFLISYCLGLTGASPLGVAAAVAIPAIGFGLVHRYQPWRSVALIVWLSLVFGAIFVLSGSLLVPILLHIGLDLTATWLGVVTLRRRPELTEAPAAG